MSVEDAKTLFRHYMDELANHGNLQIVDTLVSPEYVEHEAPPPGWPVGREGIKHFFAVLRQAFPDLELTFEDQIADGDKVVARVRCRGTHRGTFLGIPPTGNRVSYEAIDIVRIVHGRVVEHWGVTDTYGLLQQLQPDESDGRRQENGDS